MAFAFVGTIAMFIGTKEPSIAFGVGTFSFGLILALDEIAKALNDK